LQRVEDVGEGHAHRLDLHPVDFDVELGGAGTEAVEEADEPGLLVALCGQGIGLDLQSVEVHVARGLYHQLEAAGIAQAAHRRRPEDQHAGLENLPPETGAELRRDGLSAQRRISAFVKGMEDGEQEAIVRAHGVQDQ
jgi:hypothetical protein